MTKLNNKQIFLPPVGSFPQKLKQIIVERITEFVLRRCGIFRKDFPPILDNKCGWFDGLVGEHSSP